MCQRFSAILDASKNYRADRQKQKFWLNLSTISQFLVITGSVFGLDLFASSSVKAQISTDGSVATEVNNSDNVSEITGGTRAGNHLFHSFQEFSVTQGSTAFFNNATDIGNIISRVTGGSISNIDGLIRANGNANVILINPAGINFGADAQLDIGGSFLSSTAESLVFEDGTIFSARNPEASPLLTVTVPVGLQLGQNSSGIQVAGSGNLGSNLQENTGLAVSPGNTLALVGKEISFNGGILRAESGRIELGSVAAGQVSLTNIASGWQLGYEQITQFADLELLAKSSLGNPNSSSNPDGGIQIQGKNIAIDSSQVVAQTLENQPGADLLINASESLSIQGLVEDATIFGSQILNEVTAEASGNGGAINVNTPQLVIEDGGQISSLTRGNGVSGDITVAAESVLINGINPVEPTFRSAIFNDTSSAADGGNINISTQSLRLQDGGQIFTLVGPTETGEVASGARSGNAGDVTINARESIEVFGVSSLASDVPSDLASFTLNSGDAGDVTVSTKRLTIGNGGFVESGVLTSSTSLGAPAPGSGTGDGGNLLVNASESIEVFGVNPLNFDPSALNTFTFGSGNAGETTVNTPRLIVRDGGQVSSQTAAEGNAGRITVNAPEIIVSGQEPNTEAPAEISANAFLFDEEIRDDFFLPDFPTGNSGELIINSEQITVTEGGRLAVQNDGTGNAGNLNISADSILLDNEGTISAASKSDVGGNIILEANNIFLLGNSAATAAAKGTGNGGNINIQADNLVVLENSELTADADVGKGGNIAINTQSLFKCGECQISASSQVGVDGVVNIINTLEPNTNLEIVDLPEQLAQPQQAVTLACSGEQKPDTSTITINGRGGLPPRPNEALSSQSLVSFARSDLKAEQSSDNMVNSNVVNSDVADSRKLPSPAKSWYINNQGVVVLTAKSPTAGNANASRFNSSNCHVR